MKYSIFLSAVSKKYQSRVTIHLTKILGQGKKDTIHNLIHNGGTILESIPKVKADQVAAQLRKLGAVIEVSQDKTEQKNDGFKVTLLDIGKNKLQVVKEINTLTRLGLKKSKLLVDNLGVVGSYKNKSEAYDVKQILESVGAKILVTKLGGAYQDIEPVEPKRPISDGFFIVFGQVLLSNQQPAKACIVRAFDREMRSEQFLGETVTDRQGSYRIQYTSDQFRRAEKEAADLVIRVYNKIDKILSESDIYFNIPNETRIDILLSKTAPFIPSEFELLVALLTPLLDNVSLSDLTSDDIRFLANKTGHCINEISYLSQAMRLSQNSGISEAVFFALAKENIGVIHPEKMGGFTSIDMTFPILDLAIILEESVDLLIKTLKLPIKQNTVPNELLGQLVKIELQFTQLVSEGIEESIFLRSHRYKKLGQIAGLPDRVIGIVANRLAENINDADVWEDLVKEGILQQYSIDILKFTINFGTITNYDFQYTEALVNLLPSNLGKDVITIKDLAALKLSDWETILNEIKIDPSGETSNSEYARMITEKIENL